MTTAKADDDHARFTTAAADGLDALLRQRYSCRGFRSDPVPRETITRILEIAQRTPSWCNSQPWQVLVASAPATNRFRDALLRHARENERAPDIAPPQEYRGVYQERRRECGLQLYESVGVARGDRVASARQGEENYRFFGAPHAAVVTTEALLGTYGVLDCGAYVNNFMLAARALGVASIAQAAVAMHSKFLHEYFGIGEDRLVVCGIAFGYEDPEHPANRFRTSRAPVEQAATWID